MNRFRRNMSLLSLVLVVLMLAGCLPSIGGKEYTLTVNVKPEGAAEVKGIDSKYKKNALATFELIAADGYEFVDWEGTQKPTAKDGKWEIVMDGDKTLTAVFKTVEEEPTIDELIWAAEEAIANIPAQITLEDASKIQAARELVEAVLAIDEDAEIEGIAKLEAAEEALQKLSWHSIDAKTISNQLVAQNPGLDLTKVFKDKEIKLVEKLTIGNSTFVLNWTTNNPAVVTFENGVAKFTTPEEDTKVKLTASIGYELGALASPQSFDFEVTVWGLVSELKEKANGTDDDAFENVLKLLVADYDKSLVGAYKEAIAIAGQLKLETKEDVLNVISAVNGEVVKALNEAVAAYYSAITKKGQVDALNALEKAQRDMGLSSWVSELVEGYYLPALRDGDTSSVTKIQAIVFAVNLDVLEEKVAAAEADPKSTSKFDAAQGLFTGLKLDKVAGFEELAEEYAARLGVLDWLKGVLNADADGIYSALTDARFKDFVELKDAIDDDVVNAAYTEAIASAYAKNKALTVADIQEIVITVNAAQLEKAVKAVLAATNGDVLAKLADLKAIAGSKVWTATIKNELGEEYVKAIASAKPSTAAEINAVVLEVNMVDRINSVGDSGHVIDIIVNRLKVEEFINLTPKERREEVAEYIAKAITQGNKKYKSTTEFKSDVVARVSAYLEAIDAVEKAKTNTEMIAALQVAFKLHGHSSSVSVEMAEKVFTAMNQEDFKGFNTIQHIVDIVDPATTGN